MCEQKLQTGDTIRALANAAGQDSWCDAVVFWGSPHTVWMSQPHVHHSLPVLWDVTMMMMMCGAFKRPTAREWFLASKYRVSIAWFTMRLLLMVRAALRLLVITENIDS